MNNLLTERYLCEFCIFCLLCHFVFYALVSQSYFRYVVANIKGRNHLTRRVRTERIFDSDLHASKANAMSLPISTSNNHKWHIRIDYQLLEYSNSKMFSHNQTDAHTTTTTTTTLRWTTNKQEHGQRKKKANKKTKKKQRTYYNYVDDNFCVHLCECWSTFLSASLSVFVFFLHSHAACMHQKRSRANFLYCLVLVFCSIVIFLALIRLKHMWCYCIYSERKIRSLVLQCECV